MKTIDKRIYIFSYDNYCGGTIVLSELCRCLCRLGYDARLIREVDKAVSKNIKVRIAYYVRNIIYTILQKINIKSFLDYTLPAHFSNVRIAIFPSKINDDSIVLYPEIIYGNPLMAKNVVRWLLYYYEYSNDKEAYSPNDLFICYREIFNDAQLNPDNLTVHINAFDNSLYRQYNYQERSGNCYIIRKGRNRADLPKHFDGPIIDNLKEEEKVAVFNQCKYCYSYDTQTFYSQIASVCGCVSIVVPEPGKTRKDYLYEDDNIGYGVAYGDSESEIIWATETRSKLLESLDFYENNIQNAKHFIEILSEYFHEY